MEKKEIKIKIKDEDIKGTYSNLMIVSHRKEEFCLDFINTFNPPILNARIITSPAHLKRMISALQENMKRYEEQFGEIEASQGASETVLGFQPPTSK